jgi:MoaA/NifB/PqqE/SkfB family radical SAM enzyme
VLLDLVLDYDCNLACDYCTITPEMRRRSLPTGAIVRQMRAARDEGFDRVSFTGGEPTIRRDLLPLVREARRLGYDDIKVQSNGLLYAEEGNVDRLVEAGVTRWHVSIHTHRAEAYERMVRRAGTHPLMERGLSNLVARGLDPIADQIVMRDTHTHLQGALDWLADRGVRRSQLWLVSLTDGNAENVASLPPLGELMPSVFAAFDRADARGLELRSLHLPHCLLGERKDRALDPAAGGVRVVTPDAVLDLRDAKLTPRRYVAACEGCPEKGTCPGVRPDYLERYGDAEIARVRGVEPRVAGAVRLPVI